MFSGANNTMINGGTFTAVYQNTKNEKATKLLLENIASGAFHNAAERFDAPKCHPETRKTILNEIMQWIEDVDKHELFLWLYGPAGAGKSSIAQSIAELCDKAGILDASFFFSRTAAGRNNDRLLIPTLTYQLSLTIPDILQFVGEALNRDPLVFGRSLQAQIDTLLLKPLSQVAASRQNLEHASNSRPIFFIIDGLDECGEAKSQSYILSLLSSAIRCSAIPLFFLITSRPEQDIRQSFNAEPLNSLTRRLVLDDNYKPNEDIKVFLQSKFDDIKKNHPSRYFLPAAWPSDSDLEFLVKKSSGQFIYASTVIKFVDSPRHRPTERLNMILGLQPTGNNMPFAALDELYMHIFLAVADIEAVIRVFEVLLFFPILSNASIDDVEIFLCLTPGELQIILSDLHSIIAVPSPQKNANVIRHLRLFHASLGDFLLDKARSGNLFIDAREAHAHMARYCIRHMPMTFLTMEYQNGPAPQDHRTLSHRAFLEQCRKADLGGELLQDLYNFNFEAFLNYGVDYMTEELPLFFEWIKEQCNLNNETNLYQLYMCHFDNYLIAHLSMYPQGPHPHLLFAAFTLPLYSTPPSDLLSAITHGMDSSDERNFELADQNGLDLNGVQFSNRNSGYHSMLLAFFMDPTRSGIYHVTKSRYVSLAAKCLKYLANIDPVYIEQMWRIEQPPLFLLHRILLHIPPHRKLATVLQDNPLPQQPRFVDNKLLKDELTDLIKSYIKVIEPGLFLQGVLIDLMPYLTRSDGQLEV